jgi:LysR family transcriptional activator of nhaA
MLNYKQLHYFWRVAKDGGITRASERLHLTPQTLSGQIALLENNLGTPLFKRLGRRLELTDTGRLALSYAEDIFSAGNELEQVLRASPEGRPLLLRVGIADVLPKSIAYHLLAPAMGLADPVRLVCREDKLPRLLAELAIHRLDLVLADSPMPADTEVKGYSHRLGECGVALLARPDLAAGLTGDFPACLDGAPLLIPGEGTAMRGRLLRWLADQDVHPRIVGEFDDSALMRAFGQNGGGVFPAPALIADEVCRQDGVRVVGQSEAVSERFHAISVERRVSHPAVLAILEAASQGLFA